jgi:hypothetical protein
VSPDQRGQVKADDLSVAHAHLSVDDAEVDDGRSAEDQRCQRVVQRAGVW